jgi:hypothetical protein
MRGPSGLVALLPAYLDQRAVPKILFFQLLIVAISYRSGQSRPKLDKLAVPLQDLRRGIYFEPACWAFPCLRRQDAAAFGAKLDDWFPVRAALVEVSIGLAVVEVVEMNIGHEPETLVIAGMIEDDQMILALARPQPAPDRLDKPNSRLCRSGIDYTSNVQVNTCI